MADANPKKPAAKRAPRKKPAARKPAAAKTQEPTAEQREAIIAAHVAEQEREQQEAVSLVRYIRNMSGAPFRMKLGRHTAGQRGIQLKPRGERGDIAPLEDGDMEDMILRDNLNLGLIEIITSNEAIGAMGKQTINQQAVHPALAALKNSQGEGGMTLNVEKSFEDQGVTVAQLEDGQVVFDKGQRGQPTIRRQPGESPGVPANIPGAEPGHAPANEPASFLSDLRSKTTVNPPQQS